jgi:hypothetical protein
LFMSIGIVYILRVESPKEPPRSIVYLGCPYSDNYLSYHCRVYGLDGYFYYWAEGLWDVGIVSPGVIPIWNFVISWVENLAMEAREQVREEMAQV